VAGRGPEGAVRKKKRLHGVVASWSGRCAQSGPTCSGPSTSSSTPQTSDGKTLKLLNVFDEFTRECPAIVTERSIDADGVVACLEKIAAVRGAPVYLGFDNGTGTIFIDPGSQNAWIESFNGRLRDEHLNGQQCASPLEAQVFTEDWRIGYNCNRPSLEVSRVLRDVV
jgi:putative transposase